jgi:hypothetical protein
MLSLGSIMGSFYFSYYLLLLQVINEIMEITVLNMWLVLPFNYKNKIRYTSQISSDWDPLFSQDVLFWRPL